MSHSRAMIVNLPELRDTDVVDMIRVFTAITDALIEHHQVQLQQQMRYEQPDLFDAQEPDQAPF